METEKPKILMIEDDLFLRKLYRDQFTLAGFHFIEAINGVEGINKVVGEEPDLVLLDLILPRKNGFDVLADMKKNRKTKHIPVIILSHLPQESDIQEGFRLGAKDYLVKTDVRLSDVVEKVKQVLREEKT